MGCCIGTTAATDAALEQDDIRQQLKDYIKQHGAPKGIKSNDVFVLIRGRPPVFARTYHEALRKAGIPVGAPPQKIGDVATMNYPFDANYDPV
jgi:ATP-dependent exoDNAse (exonuclease V) beta subunit